MKIDEGLKLHRSMCKEELKVRERKAHDYSGDEDILANFKVRAKICAVLEECGMGIDITTYHGVAALDQLTKFCRFQSLVARNAKPYHESLADTVLDERVYCELKREAHIEWSRERLCQSLQHTTGHMDG